MNFSPSRVVNQSGLLLFLTVLAFLPYSPSVRAGTLSVTNGSFTNLTGLVNHGGGWYGGVPAGWSTATTPANAYTVLLSGETYYANLQQLGGTAPFAPLRQNLGTVDITSDVTLTFTRNTLSGTSSLGSAIYDLALPAYTSALGSYSSGSISGASTVSYTARGVGPGTSLYIAFWNGSSAAGISGVSIADSATTYAWNGGVSGTWSGGGGGWTDKFDNTAATYNNAKPVVAQFTNAAAGTNVTVAANGVTAGNMQVKNSSYDFTGGTITMTNTTWSVEAGQTATAGSSLAGTTGLIKADAGTLALSASNSYSGGTTVNDGTLALQNANALGSGNLTVNGGTLDLGGSSLTAANLGGTGGTIALGGNTLTASMTSGRQFDGTISGSGGLLKTGASYLTLAGSNSYTGGTVVHAGTLFVTGSGTLGDAAGTVTVSNAVLDLRNAQTRTGTIAMIGQDARLLSGTGAGSLANNGGALQFGGGQITSISISGTGGLNVTGGGSLNSSNSFTGATTISATPGWYGANTLYVVNAHALGAASGDLTISGGTVDLQGNTITRSGNVTISGGTVSAGTLSKSGGNFDVQGGTINAVLGGTAGLVKSGAGTNTLAASNSYSGATDLQAGTLSLSGSGRLGSGAITVSNGASLNFATGVGQTHIVANSISGAGQLLNNNSSETRFTGVVTSTGGLIINSGTVRIGNGGTTGSYTGNTALNGGTLAFDRSDSFTYGGIISGNGSLSKVSSGTVYLAGNSTNFGGTLTIFAGTARIGDGATNGVFSGNASVRSGTTLAFDRSDNSAYGGTISGAGSLVKVNTGAMTLSASNSYSGATTLIAGTLVADHASALGSGDITFSSAGGNTGTVRYTTNSAGTDWSSRLKNSTGTIRLDTDGNNVNLVGAIDSSNVGGLAKSGAGTLTLSGNNSYTGATVVNAGALQVASAGSISSSSATVNSGGVLDVEGTVGSVTVNRGGRVEGDGSVGVLTIASGGILAPGNSPGTLNASSANWNAGGIYDWDLASALGNDSGFLTGQGTNWDFLNVSGILDIGAAAGGNEFIINIVDLLAESEGTFDAGANYSFAIATAAGGITNFLSSDFIFTGFLANSNNWSVGLVGNGGTSQSLILSYAGATAIPEPSAGVLVVFGLSTIALRKRLGR